MKNFKSESDYIETLKLERKIDHAERILGGVMIIFFSITGLALLGVNLWIGI